MATKKRYVQVGVGGRARFFYNAVGGTYTRPRRSWRSAISTAPVFCMRKR